MQITIVGAGAIGGTIGAFLTKAGHDVTLVDIVPEHVKIMNEQGLRITGIRGDHRYPVKAILADELTGPLGTVFLCVKGHLTEGAIQQIAPLLADDGYVVSIQNGLNEEIIEKYIGRERTVGCFVHFGADYIEPGVVQLGQDRDIFIGELDGQVTPRAEQLRDTLSAVMPAHVTTNIWGYLWGKLVYASMAFVVSTVDAPSPDVLDDPRGRQVSLAASAEAARVADAQGYKMEMIGGFDPNAFLPGPGWEDRANATLDDLAAETRASIKQHMGIWRDLKVKKRKTEIDMQCGPIASWGRRLNIPTPVNDEIIRVVYEIEDGKRGMGWDNLDVLLAAVPASSGSS